MRNLVPIPKTCEALKAAGFTQITRAAYRLPSYDLDVWRVFLDAEDWSSQNAVSAPTLQEIIPHIKNLCTKRGMDLRIRDVLDIWDAPNGAEAAAQLWLTLQSQS